MLNKKIGFIGQGWIGKNYANDFEDRGYNVIRYALEEPYVANGDKICDCDIVFIAVPTPSTPEGFDDSILRQAIKSVGKGKIAVIKSTLLPGMTESIQDENPEIFVMHSPEFLVEVTAEYDAKNPNRNIIGIPKMTETYKQKAQEVIDVLPNAPYKKICFAKEAEFIKYGGNNLLYFKVVFMNMLYDLANGLNCDWEVIKESLAADPRLGQTHLEPNHKSGRGAGGHCFIKDFAALIEMYEKNINDEHGMNLLKSMERKNIDLLLKSEKDLDLLKGVYGDDVINN